MKHEGYKIRNPYGVYFITFATVQWVDVFSRAVYVDTVLDSLRFCIREKGLRLRPWCLMTNHVHLIASAEKGDLPAIIRDFKKFILSSVIKGIEKNAAGTGCYGFLRAPERRIAIMRNISFGSRITSRFSCRVFRLR